MLKQNFNVTRNHAPHKHYFNDFILTLSDKINKTFFQNFSFILEILVL